VAELAPLLDEITGLAGIRVYGRVTAILGMLIEVGGASRSFAVGDRCTVIARDDRAVLCEVIGFRNARALLMPFHPLDGVGLGCRVYRLSGRPVVRPHRAWLGRVVNAMGEPIDGKGPLPHGSVAQLLRSQPPPAHSRRPVGDKIDLGVRAVNTFLTCCRGQRMGIFAASGVGKSVLLSMFARFTSADVNVIGLIGERGREVQEFLNNQLGADGMARSVVVVATSDETALMRRQAADLTLALAEYFRDQDKDVLCMIDSVTRIAMAQREIGLSVGEPPANKGYTPTVFSELPKLLERAGTGIGRGTITGLFTVLVEGDDHDEPVADAVRSILDGHIVLERSIAERGRYPAINVLRSVSRTMPACNAAGETALVTRARALIARYDDMAEMIRLGAYQQGADPTTDEAIHYNARLESFLAQEQDEKCDFATAYQALADILADGRADGTR
jgi:flagellum-specific ATP synthase